MRIGMEEPPTVYHFAHFRQETGRRQIDGESRLRLQEPLDDVFILLGLC